MGRLIGYRTLGDIVLGRYHLSRTEERFFLFIDIAGSTPLAERIVSGDALERLADLDGFALEDPGLQQLRGRAARNGTLSSAVWRPNQD